MLAGLVGGVIGALLAAGLVVVVDDDRDTSVGVATAPVARPAEEVDAHGRHRGDPRRRRSRSGRDRRRRRAGAGRECRDRLRHLRGRRHCDEPPRRQRRGRAIEARFSDGTSLPARVLGTDVGSDLAVLHVDAAGLPTIELGNSDTRAGRRRRRRDRQRARTRRGAERDARHRVGARPHRADARRLRARRRDPDRRGDQPGQLGRPARRRAGSRHRDQHRDRRSRRARRTSASRSRSRRRNPSSTRCVPATDRRTSE